MSSVGAILIQPTVNNVETQVATNIIDTPRTKPTKPYIPEKSQKRDLSTGSTPSPTSVVQYDKRQRSDIDEFNWDLTQTVNMEPEVTLADIMDQLKMTAKVSNLADVAKKRDLIKLQNTVSSHSVEILQLKDDLKLHAQRIQQLEESLGQYTASVMNRPQPDVDILSRNQYGGPQARASQFDSRRKNLVFEGIPNMPDRDVVGYIVALCSALKIIAYPSDIESIVRMNRRDGTSKPAPVLATFDQLHIRSSILRKKSSLAEINKYDKVFINLDEPIETRRAKAIFRRIGYCARQDGKTVLIRDDWISIDDVQFKVNDINKIPEPYRVDMVPRPKPTAVSDRSDGNAEEGSQPLNHDGTRPKETGHHAPERTRKVKIKLTKAGLTFSGPTAYLSHMFTCPFVHQKKTYCSVEQGYHHIHATVEGEMDIAKTILNTHNAYDIKDVADPLPKSEKWNNMAPTIVMELNLAKYGQNPQLMKQLLETAPHKLIEASVDSKWGGACPFGSDIYEQGIVPGANLCGEQLTKLRDDELAQRSDFSMT